MPHPNDLWRCAVSLCETTILLPAISLQVYNPKETAQILDLPADRLGHMCYLNNALEAELKASKIPLELCLSSNVLTESVTGFPDHHFLPLFRAGNAT